MSIITLAGCKLPKNCAVQSPMKLHNVIYFRQSDLKYAKNDLKVCKNDLKYYDLKWDFPLGGLILHDTYTLEHNLFKDDRMQLLTGKTRTIVFGWVLV